MDGVIVNAKEHGKRKGRMEGFEYELQRINEEYREAGRKYSFELGKGRPSVSEVSEGIEVYKAEAKPEEVTPPQELPQESKIKPSLCDPHLK